ncbi:hypothetical protein SY88_10930 [Clostridiales bacterium PH28_bin88]|nr:hypothetical protein SY88_10930 [Clostridiales bacterium PH28_bin88]
MLAGCGGKSGQQQPQQQQPSSTEAKKPGKVVVGSKQFAEQYILGYMIAELLKAKTDLEVDDSLVGMGATELLHPAMLKGQLDLYPEYTGTGLMVVLKEQMISDKQAAYDKVKSEYEKQFKIIWLPPFGFEDTFAIGVRAETAQKLGLETLSDLAKRPELVFMGDETTWTRPDQYPGLQKVYGFNNKVKKTMDINLKYEALAKGEVDIIPGFSTEGNLKKYNVKVMKDDKQFFPPYDAAIVIRQETLEKYPQVGEVLKPLFGSITEADMIELNYQVEVEKKEPLEVAKSFLKKRGLI